MSNAKSRKLRELLSAGPTLVVPDAYDALSARLIERAGYQAVQCSGASIAITSLLPSEFALTLDANVEATSRIVQAVEVPVMADGEDGYGDPEAVQEAVRRFVEVGVAGVNIEDQVPERATPCRIVDADLMVDKIVAAREAATSCGAPDLIVNARTDALRAFADRAEGLEEAIVRANRYLEAGGDLAFICYADRLEEVETLVRGIDGPISIAAGMPYNLRELPLEALQRLGVARVSLPMLAITATVQALQSVMGHAAETGGFSRIADEGLCCPLPEAMDVVRR